jgi:hypothetical protein
MGLDVGDRKSHDCVLDEVSGEILREGTVATTGVALREMRSREMRSRARFFAEPDVRVSQRARSDV